MRSLLRESLIFALSALGMLIFPAFACIGAALAWGMMGVLGR